MIRHVFIFGVILPTIVTVSLFIIFLVCWFRCGLQQRLFSSNGSPVTSKKLNQAASGSTAQNNGSEKVTTQNGLVVETTEITVDCARQNCARENEDYNSQNKTNGYYDACYKQQHGYLRLEDPPQKMTLYHQQCCHQCRDCHATATLQQASRNQRSKLSHNDNGCYTNPNLCLSPTDPECPRIPAHDQEHIPSTVYDFTEVETLPIRSVGGERKTETFVQQTFHFPVDSDAASEDGGPPPYVTKIADCDQKSRQSEENNCPQDCRCQEKVNNIQ